MGFDLIDAIVASHDIAFPVPSFQRIFFNSLRGKIRSTFHAKAFFAAFLGNYCRYWATFA